MYLFFTGKEQEAAVSPRELQETWFYYTEELYALSLYTQYRGWTTLWKQVLVKDDEK